MSGYPPQKFNDFWIFIVAYNPDGISVLIEVRENEEGPGERFQVVEGDLVKVGQKEYKILTVRQPVDHRGWVEIDSVPQ